MSELPKGWVETTISGIFDLNPKHVGLNDEVECGFIPMEYVPTNYHGETSFEAKSWERCKKGYTHFRDKDVLLAKITPCFENGKSTIVSDLPNGVGAGSTEFFVLRHVENNVLPKYLYSFIKTKEFLINCEVNMCGSVGHKRVPKDYLLNYPIPVAPQAEQTRIVEKLDEVLAQVDTIKARLDGIPAILKRFRQSVLAAAVSGRLTEEWRKIHKLELGPKCLVGDISEVVRGGSPRPSGHPDFFGGKIPWITVKELTKDRNIYLTTTSDTLTELGATKSRVIEIGTLLLTNSGATLGVPKISKIRGCINDGIVAIRGLDEDLKLYLYYCLSSMTESLRNINQGAAQPNLNTTIVKNIDIILPSVDEQKEIVRLVDQYFAFADTIEAQVKKAQARVDNLTQSILAKAFRGELVAQDPGDEPAEKLLERIAQARKEAEALAKAAKKVAKPK